MDLRTAIARAALTVALILGIFWAIWLAGRVSFNSDGEHPPDEGRGKPTTVQTTAPG